MRYTNAFIRARFTMTASVAKWDYEGSAWSRQGDQNVAKIGHVSLTHNQYSGWAVEEMMNEGGGMRNLIEGLTARELVSWLDGVRYGAQRGAGLARAALNTIAQKATGDALTFDELQAVDAACKAL